MDYQPIINKLMYWKNDGVCSGEEYRKLYDFDCIITGGNLNADTIISLWLPLRYTLNYFNKPKWVYWKEYEAEILRKQHLTLKNCVTFIEDIEKHIEEFLPKHEITEKLINLFEIGNKRCNVMILPYRSWNTRRGQYPYYDYLPHFFYDLLKTNNSAHKKQIVNWIKEERLTMFFKDEIIDKEHVLDLAGTGFAYIHYPNQISLSTLLTNYISILETRNLII